MITNHDVCGQNVCHSDILFVLQLLSFCIWFSFTMHRGATPRLLLLTNWILEHRGVPKHYTGQDYTGESDWTANTQRGKSGRN